MIRNLKNLPVYVEVGLDSLSKFRLEAAPDAVEFEAACSPVPDDVVSPRKILLYLKFSQLWSQGS